VYLRVEEAMSHRQIAGEAFDGAISGEGVRQAALSYDIEAERDPEDLSPRELALRYSAEKDDTDAPAATTTRTRSIRSGEAIGNYLRFVNEYTHTIVRFRFRSAGGSMRPRFDSGPTHAALRHNPHDATILRLRAYDCGIDQ